MSPPRGLARIFGASADEPIKILIADDEAQVRVALRRTFENDRRFEIVGEATDGGDAVNLVGVLRPDVLLLDLAMPNTNGMEAIPEILKAGPGTKVIVFSSWVPFDDMRSKAEAAGATLALDKFTPPRKLVKAVLKVAAQR